MEFNHFHVYVKDLKAAINWLKNILDLEPTYKNELMASYNFGPSTFILDQSETDEKSTIGFSSENCDEDFKKVVERGAEVIEKPNNKDWGVRAAYIKGPGKIIFEIEQMLEEN